MSENRRKIRIDNLISNVGEKVEPAMRKTLTIGKGKKKIVVKPVKLAVFTVVCLVLVALICQVASMFEGSKSVRIAFDSDNAYRAVSSGSCTVLYNNSGAKAISKKGRVKWEISEALSEPIAETDGNYLMLADLSGNHFAACYKNGKKKYDCLVGDDIISAKVTPKGYSAVATDTDGYKGKVSVFAPSGREVYAWSSGSGYISDIDLSDNGRYLAVSQIVVDNGKTDSKIQIVDTRKSTVIATVERPDEAGVEVKFVSENRIVFVTDSAISGYSKHGKILFEISLAGKNASLYSTESEKMFAVVCVNNRGNSVLELYSANGKPKGVYTADGDIRALSVSGTKAIVAEQKGIVRLGGNGKKRHITKINHDIKDICYFSDGGKFIAVGTSQVEVIKGK